MLRAAEKLGLSQSKRHGTIRGGRAPHQARFHGGQAQRPRLSGHPSATSEFRGGRPLTHCRILISHQGFVVSPSFVLALLLPSSLGADVAGSDGVEAAGEDGGESRLGDPGWASRSDGANRDAFLS
jgi:hypothetical protein